jgi:hypothetical protein
MSLVAGVCAVTLMVVVTLVAGVVHVVVMSHVVVIGPVGLVGGGLVVLVAIMAGPGASPVLRQTGHTTS